MSKRIFTTKFFVAFSLAFSMIGMGTVVGMGMWAEYKDIPADVPAITLKAKPTSIKYNAKTTLTWKVKNADACAASGGWSGAKNPESGKKVIKSLKKTTIFYLACVNYQGGSNAKVKVKVAAKPVVKAPTTTNSSTANTTTSSGGTTTTSTCGSGGSCTSAEVAKHSSNTDCWTIVGSSVYKITSTFIQSTHSGTLGGPNLTGKICGKNITSKFNSIGEHNTSRGGGNATWWLTANGNSYIGPWAGR